jgi:hypothetical protein
MLSLHVHIGEPICHGPEPAIPNHFGLFFWGFF